MPDIHLILNASELGAGTRGASLGIDAMKTAARNQGHAFFSLHPQITVPDENISLDFHPNWETQAARNLSKILDIHDNHLAEVKKVLDGGNFPVVLAAEHSTAAATIAGLKKHYHDKRLGVIWIDAHADLHTPYTTPSGNIHGMSLAMAIGIDHQENRRLRIEGRMRNLSEATVKNWERAKNTGGICPKIQPQDIVFISVRDAEYEERKLIEKHGISNFSVASIRNTNTSKIVQETLKKLSDCDLIYVSFDVDSMDCDDVSRGTGTPVPNGLSVKEAKDLVEELVRQEKVCCLEITEVNPTLDDKGNAMAEAAFEILANAVNAIEQRLKG